MRTVRLALVLPVVQGLIVAIVLVWRDLAVQLVYQATFRISPHELRVDECVIMTDAILRGINAPAIFFELLALSVGLRDHPVFGVAIENLFYLVGVFVLWYFVGKTLDHRISPSSSKIRGTSPGRPWINLSLIGLGALLLSGSVQSYRAFAHYNYQRGWFISVAIGLIWGLVLVIFPGLSLTRWIRRGTTGSC